MPQYRLNRVRRDTGSGRLRRSFPHGTGPLGVLAFESDQRRRAGGTSSRADFHRAQTTAWAPREAAELPPPCVGHLDARARSLASPSSSLLSISDPRRVRGQVFCYSYGYLVRLSGDAAGAGPVVPIRRGLHLGTAERLGAGSTVMSLLWDQWGRGLSAVARRHDSAPCAELAPSLAVIVTPGGAIRG